MKKIFLLLTYINFSVSCAPERLSPPLDALLGSNKSKDNIELFDLFESFEFFPMNEVNIYSDEVSQIKVANNYIFFTEKYSGKLFRYNIDTDETFTLLKYGLGPGEVQEISEFQAFKNILFIFSKPQNKLFLFNLHGELLFERKIGFYPSAFSIYNGELLFRNGFFEKLGFYLRRSDIDLEQVEHIGEYPVLLGQTDFEFTGHLFGGYYSYPFSTKIFKVDENMEKEFINFSLPNPVPDDEVFEHSKIMNYLNDFQNPKNYMLKFILENNEGFFQFSMNNTIKYAVLLKSNELLGINDFNNAGNLFLLLGLPLEYKDGYFYSTINPRFKEWFSMSEKRDEVLTYYHGHNKEFSDFLSGISENSPPVIMKFKLRSKI